MRDIELKKNRVQRSNSWRDVIVITFEKQRSLKKRVKRGRSIHALAPLMLLAQSKLNAAEKFRFGLINAFYRLRIGITITTYIYVGESLGSQEDPFTARNREFRLTLRGPKRRH
ncbi:hypothetical protein ALC57_11326 [Trachymyrmex cornetzi]|uniref:Uncharacterized protein n=1 Tax=Trachymyrmex cornetzi TaxID=471704 RepID=A0A195DUC7_9HYME|nr:hypothetical protein ALC57_11326 [Trachymyrmex cornetzi]